VPVIIDAGIGTASQAALAMEMGAGGVLTNTAIAKANNSIVMAEAMKLGVLAGRTAFKAGRIHVERYAQPSSTTVGLSKI
jgi:thiazole synthase